MYSMIAGFSVFIWALSVVWLAVSAFRLIFPSKRRSAKRHLVMSVALFAITLTTTVIGAQYEYKDYGLSSREGLEQVKAAAKEAEAAEEAKKAADQKILNDEKATAAALQKDKDDAERRDRQIKEAAEKSAREAAEKAEASRKKCSDKTMAFVMSQHFVKQNLKAPSTAEFPWFSDNQVNVVTVLPCAFKVVAYVDAQNGFGAQVRSRYVVELNYLEATDEWRMTDIAIQ